MKLWEYVGENVKLKLIDGRVIKGFVRFWNDEDDTEDGEDEIVIGHEIYGLSDIKSIEIVKE